MEPFEAVLGTKCTPYLEARVKGRSGVNGLRKKSKFHFVQYLKQVVPCKSTDKGASSRGSRVRTTFYGSIIDSGIDRVLTMCNLTIH